MIRDTQGKQRGRGMLEETSWRRARLAAWLAAWLACVSCAGAGSFAVTPVTPATTDDLLSVWCMPGGGVYALDRHGGAHPLEGRGPRVGWDDGGPVTVAGGRLYQVRQGQLRRSDDGGAHWTPLMVTAPADVPYGRASLLAVAAGASGTPLFALGRYLAIGNSLESAYVYLVRSDDGGTSWSRVWTGSDEGPMGLLGGRHGPGVTAALAVLPGGAIALGGMDGSVLVSSDGGRTFVARPTPAKAAILGLWAAPRGALYGVGVRGAIVVSTDGGRTFSAANARVASDLYAVTGCAGHVWIVGAHGAALRQRRP